MLISDQHRLILMLPQKCASRTLQQRLKSIRDVAGYGESGQRYYSELGRLIGKHMLMRDVCELEAYRSRATHLKACFVRNPYDRIYSWFHWQKTRIADAERIQRLRRELEAAEDVKEIAKLQRNLNAAETVLKQLESADHNFNRYLLQNRKRFRPIHQFTHLDGVLQMDFIGRVEDFEADFSRLCEQIGFTCESVESANITPGAEFPHSDAPSHYLHYYEAEAIEAVNHDHALDFEYFAYDRAAY